MSEPVFSSQDSAAASAAAFKQGDSHHQRKHDLRWLAASTGIACLTLLPLAVVLSSFLRPDLAIWQHLWQYVLPDLLRNSLVLLTGVCFGTALIGTALAWLVAVCEFPGRRFFSWALLLPLAMPAYVAAFAAIGLYDFTGPLQTFARDTLGWSVRWPSIRSSWGVILIFSLSFYPYVYLLARNAFQTQGQRALEVGQSLGLGPWQGFFCIALPAARPWLFAGLLLVAMETLADFGTVSVFNYDTFTTAIYKSWFGMFSMNAASQLASLLVLLVLVLLLFEQKWRGQRHYHATGRTAARRYALGGRAWLASGFAGLILCLAFILPAVQLLYWVVQVFAADFDARYPMFAWHSLLLSSASALLVVVCALVLACSARFVQTGFMQWLVRLATLGYAIPGTVLAVGIFIPLAWFDNQLLALLRPYGIAPQLSSILRGSLWVLLLAYVARFLAAGFGPVETALHRVTRSQEEAARSLGVGGWRLFSGLYLGMLRPGLLTAALLVFVDVMKEMPITLMMRPFGWDTLATRVFEMTSEGQWDRAALPAMALLLVGLLPVYFLNQQAEISPAAGPEDGSHHS